MVGGELDVDFDHRGGGGDRMFLLRVGMFLVFAASAYREETGEEAEYVNCGEV